MTPQNKIPLLEERKERALGDAERIEQRNNSMLIYTTADGKHSVEVNLKDDTLWLSLDEIAMLFDRNKSTISRHIKNIFESGELEPNSVVANFATTARDGKKYQVDYFNLDMIISIGYRVNSFYRIF